MQRAKTISAKRKNSKHKEVEVANAKRKNSKHKEVEVANAKRKSNKHKEGTNNKCEENKQ
jgi:hypothetical protein